MSINIPKPHPKTVHKTWRKDLNWGDCQKQCARQKHSWNSHVVWWQQPEWLLFWLELGPYFDGFFCYNIKDIQLGSRYTRYTTVDESLHQLNILNMVNLPLFTGVLAPSQVVIAGILETNSRYTVQPPPKAIFGSVFYLVEGHSFASIFVIHKGFGRPKWWMRPARSSNGIFNQVLSWGGRYT